MKVGDTDGYRDRRKTRMDCRRRQSNSFIETFAAAIFAQDDAVRSVDVRLLLVVSGLFSQAGNHQWAFR